MPRGGFRPGAGRPKKSVETPPKAVPATINRPRESLGGMTPLEFMLTIMRDPDADAARRDKMAVAAAPFVHARAEAVAPGKKETLQTEAEERAASGKYATPTAPLIN